MSAPILPISSEEEIKALTTHLEMAMLLDLNPRRIAKYLHTVHRWHRMRLTVLEPLTTHNDLTQWFFDHCDITLKSARAIADDFMDAFEVRDIR